jgi:hypothetical protein
MNRQGYRGGAGGGRDKAARSAYGGQNHSANGGSGYRPDIQMTDEGRRGSHLTSGNGGQGDSSGDGGAEGWGSSTNGGGRRGEIADEGRWGGGEKRGGGGTTAQGCWEGKTEEAGEGWRKVCENAVLASMQRIANGGIDDFVNCFGRGFLWDAFNMAGKSLFRPGVKDEKEKADFNRKVVPGWRKLEGMFASEGLELQRKKPEREGWRGRTTWGEMGGKAPFAASQFCAILCIYEDKGCEQTGEEKQTLLLDAVVNTMLFLRYAVMEERMEQGFAETFEKVVYRLVEEAATYKKAMTMVWLKKGGARRVLKAEAREAVSPERATEADEDTEETGKKEKKKKRRKRSNSAEPTPPPKAGGKKTKKKKGEKPDVAKSEADKDTKETGKKEKKRKKRKRSDSADSMPPPKAVGKKVKQKKGGKPDVTESKETVTEEFDEEENAHILEMVNKYMEKKARKEGREKEERKKREKEEKAKKENQKKARLLQIKKETERRIKEKLKGMEEEEARAGEGETGEAEDDETAGAADGVGGEEPSSDESSDSDGREGSAKRTRNLTVTEELKERVEEQEVPPSHIMKSGTREDGARKAMRGSLWETQEKFRQESGQRESRAEFETMADNAQKKLQKFPFTFTVKEDLWKLGDHKAWILHWKKAAP